MLDPENMSLTYDVIPPEHGANKAGWNLTNPAS